jgi:hypothetical protein
LTGPDSDGFSRGVRTAIGRMVFTGKGFDPSPGRAGRRSLARTPLAPTREDHPMFVYHVCDTCGPAIINDDYSAFDLQDVDTDYEPVTAFVESVGYLTDAGMVNKAGYWECESCGQVCIGSAIALEPLA